MRSFSRTKRVCAAVLLVVVATAVLPFLQGGSRALAHPLGNFTINRYSRIEVSPDTIRLRYVLDMAEIPAFQEQDAVDADGDGDVSPTEKTAYLSKKADDLRRDLELSINGTLIELRAVDSDVSFPPGQGGLSTQRIVIDFAGPMPDGWQQAAQHVEFHDRNYEDRLGWGEVVVRAELGVGVLDASVPAQDVSNELRAYPSDGISNPLDVTGATFTFEPGAGTGRTTPRESATASAISAPSSVQGRSGGRFTSLITEKEITLPFLAGALAIAFAFGMLHALGPGHGKTVVAAYLVGERGTARHAALLGLLVTVTHTSSVFALGFATLYASQFIVPERLFPWMTLMSALMVVGLGVAMLATRLRTLWRRRRTAPIETAHGHSHAGHSNEHGHTHGPPELSWQGLAALGVSGGILPCPSALVVLLGAISLHRVGLGLLLVLSFSLGLAATLVGIGLALVWTGQVFSRVQKRLTGRFEHSAAATTLAATSLPAVSALAITAVGVVMMTRVLANLGAFGL